jgi:hypothetical protein
VGDVGFSGYNIASNVSFDCHAKGVELTASAEASEWHNCSIPDTQFTFGIPSNSSDNVSGTIGLRQSWVCDDAPG